MSEIFWGVANFRYQDAMPASCSRRSDLDGFFYKYTPLPNLIVKNDPRRKILLFLAWRERQKATRGYFRHRHWRKEVSATGIGGKKFPPTWLAGSGGKLAGKVADVIPPMAVAGSMLPPLQLAASTFTRFQRFC
jgi:hypothetical protein